MSTNMDNAHSNASKSSKSTKSVNQVLMNKSSGDNAKSKLDEITINTDLSKINVNERMEIYELNEKAMISNVTMNKVHKHIVKSMHSLLKHVMNERSKLLEEMEILKSKSKQFNNDSAPLKYNSYSECVKNQVKEYTVIVRNECKDQINIQKVLYKNLKEKKRQISIKSIRQNNKRLIINTKSEAEQNLIIEKMKDVPNLKTFKPNKKIPSLFIKEIDKLDQEEKREKAIEYGKDLFDYKDYLIEEIAANNDVKKESIVIKRIQNNPKYRTIRCIVNLDIESTKRILDQKEIKIGFRVCPVEKSFKIVQCNCCYRFGHFAHDKEGNKTCKEDPLCGMCGHKLDDKGNCNQCKQKKQDGQNEEVYCLNCDRNDHPSFSVNCNERNRLLNNLINNSAC